jgi:hypothetical protein
VEKVHQVGKEAQYKQQDPDFDVRADRMLLMGGGGFRHGNYMDASLLQGIFSKFRRGSRSSISGLVRGIAAGPDEIR